MERIRREAGSDVPNVDPDGPGATARVLLILRDPGRKGALATGVLSPTKNDDATARNLRELMAEAKLDEGACLFWNALPWAQAPDATLGRSEFERGAAYLRDLVALLPDLRVVVAMGREAQRCCRLAGVEAIGVYHASPLAIMRKERRERLRKDSERVAGLATRY